jgi:uracil-DNA glycosylase family 4
LSASYEALTECRACDRLAAHLDTVREVFPDYHCRPVPASGSVSARLLVVGLAPGLHGANRTGRPFTGDASGGLLFHILAGHGFASDPDPATARLRNVRITNAVRCLPPDNRPRAGEIQRCSDFLRKEIDQLNWRRARKPRCILCLGQIAHRSVELARGVKLPKFRHGQLCQVEHHLWVADSYHPSRHNTNTGRLTEQMFDAVVACIAGLLDV